MILCTENIDISFDITDVNSDVKLKIKAAIDDNPKVTQRELVVLLGVSFRQIQQNMAEMVSDGEIIRIGLIAVDIGKLLNREWKY